MSPNGINDPLMDTMRRYGIPVTRENYMAMNEPDNMIHDNETEAMMPRQLQATSAGYARGGKVKLTKNLDAMKLIVKSKAK
jgi:hypothetical protein